MNKSSSEEKAGGGVKNFWRNIFHGKNNPFNLSNFQGFIHFLNNISAK